MIPEREVIQRMNALMRSEDSGQPWPETLQSYGWRLIRWEADVPLTEDQREALLGSVEESMRLAGLSAASFSEEEDAMTILLCMTRFPARTHRDTVMWLCAHALMEQVATLLEQEGTMYIGEEFLIPGQWKEQLSGLREISDWWSRVSPMDSGAAHAHRKSLQTAIKRRQYTVLGGHISRALRGEAEAGKLCFGFVPLVIEAVWSQHAELPLSRLTQELNLAEMTRKPREALLAWLQSLQSLLRACPAPGGVASIERVIASIRADCSLPYSQANLSRSLGLTPAYFCRLFREKAGMHFSTFLTLTRMEKAQKLLASPGEHPLAEVAESCGYPNKSYFCQVFKKYTGMTPGEYEASVKQALREGI